jgi:hypothetical protein
MVRCGWLGLDACKEGGVAVEKAAVKAADFLELALDCVVLDGNDSLQVHDAGVQCVVLLLDLSAVFFPLAILLAILCHSLIGEGQQFVEFEVEVFPVLLVSSGHGCGEVGKFVGVRGLSWHW